MLSDTKSMWMSYFGRVALLFAFVLLSNGNITTAFAKSVHVSIVVVEGHVVISNTGERYTHHGPITA